MEPSYDIILKVWKLFLAKQKPRYKPNDYWFIGLLKKGCYRELIKW